MHATIDNSDNSLDEARLRAADYRMRAEELRMRAESIGWADIRASLLKVADTYDELAQTIADIAEKQAQQTRAAACRFMANEARKRAAFSRDEVRSRFLQVADRYNALAVSIEQIAGERPSCLLEGRK
jgi:hypothetical protein